MSRQEPFDGLGKQSMSEALLDLGARLTRAMDEGIDLEAAARRLGSRCPTCRLALSFHNLDPSTQFHAMVEDWTIEQIVLAVAEAAAKVAV